MGIEQAALNRKPLDEHLLKAARRSWGWGAILLAAAIVFLIEPTSSRAGTIVLVGMAFVIAQERIRKRVDAVVQLVERLESRVGERAV